MNEFVITIDGNKNKISLINETEVKLNGEKLNYDLQKLNYQNYLLRINNTYYEISSEQVNNEKFSFLVNGIKVDLIARTELQERAKNLIDASKSSLSSTVDINAPMPGMILKINKNNGDEIKKGDSVLILEAMKMENDLKSSVTGKIKKLFVSEGNAVEKGDRLFSIE
jgi:biotin carboxyl carrier protein